MDTRRNLILWIGQIPPSSLSFFSESILSQEIIEEILNFEDFFFNISKLKKNWETITI